MRQWQIRTADWSNDSQALRAVREAVFIREQRVPVELEWDGYDAHCVHMLAVDAAGNAIGTARLLAEGKIGRMAVLREWRGRGVGSGLLLRLLEEARKQRLQQLTLHAQVYASKFYRKFGFEVMGDEFVEAGTPHVKMILRLSQEASG